MEFEDEEEAGNDGPLSLSATDSMRNTTRKALLTLQHRRSGDRRPHEDKRLGTRSLSSNFEAKLGYGQESQ